jgi:hypothetical protein
MLIDKGDLLKVLRVVSGFDTQACAFLGVQLPENASPQFHRSSPFGFIQTNQFDLTQPHIFASLGNLKDLLNVSADVMHMSLDAAGKLRLESTDEYPVRLQVHTVRSEVAGYKDHYLGNPRNFSFAGTLFNGFDIRAFKSISIPPLLEKGRLLLSTLSGVVIWTSEPLKEVPGIVQPRESFLRFIAGGGVGEILVSNQGYWIAEKDNLVCAMTSHPTPTEMLKVYEQAGTELTRFNASRLLSSLSNVSYLTGDTDRVELNPKDGIVCRDKYSNAQIFPHGATSSAWPRATIFGRTAKFIVDALSQTQEEEAVLYSVPLRNPTYRIVRGPFEVNFGLV